MLRIRGFAAVEAPSGKEAVECFTRHRPSAVLLDLGLPDMNGTEALEIMRKTDPRVPVIVVTGQSDLPTAVNAVKLGAYDFIPKPPDFEHLIITINRAVEKAALERRVTELDTALHTSFESAMGRSKAMKKVIAQLHRAASSDFSLIIEGETGTGKTWLAKFIHSMSTRAGGPFVKVSIGSLQDSVVESELFGHEKGAFTGADRTKKGYFECAEGGTLFIDDLDNISMTVQGKLLSILDDWKVMRVGNPVPIPLDIRIIGATNADLLKCISEGKLREDLFFRLSEFMIVLPPLRERAGDIIFFADNFFTEACAELDTSVCRLSEDTIEKLRQYSWPGNMRQLKNVMKRAALLSCNETITPEDIDSILGESTSPAGNSLPMTGVMTIRAAEKIAIQQALIHTKGQKLKAAALLEIDYKTLMRKIKEYEL